MGKVQKFRQFRTTKDSATSVLIFAGSISVCNQALIVEAWTMRLCRMLHTSGYRGGRATCTVMEYMLKGGRRLSTKMDTTLKINCAFGNTAVMFCEVLKCPTFKDREIKRKVLLSERPLYYHVTDSLFTSENTVNFHMWEKLEY
jgi:hypothetical protein